MLRIASLILTVSLFSTISFAQTTKSDAAKRKSQLTGFYGNRFVLQLGAGLHHNSLLKLASSYERNFRDQHPELHRSGGTDQFNYSFYGNVGVVLKEHLTLSLDVKYYLGNIVLNNYGYNTYYDQFTGYSNTVLGKTARVKYNTIGIMPRIEIGSRGSNSPVGLTHILGFGVELSKAKSGNYDAIINDNDYYYSDSLDKNSRFDFTTESAFSLTLLYGLEYRLPISKNIAWNFGGYVHLNLPVQIAIESELNGYYGFSYYETDWDAELKLRLSQNRFQNLFSLRTGLVIML